MRPLCTESPYEYGRYVDRSFLGGTPDCTIDTSESGESHCFLRIFESTNLRFLEVSTMHHLHDALRVTHSDHSDMICKIRCGISLE